MDEPDVKIIDVFMCKMRKKLANASGGRNYIETVWGRGYVCASRKVRKKEFPLKFAAASGTGSIHRLIDPRRGPSTSQWWEE